MAFSFVLGKTWHDDKPSILACFHDCGAYIYFHRHGSYLVIQKAKEEVVLPRYAYGYEEGHAGGNYALRGLRTSMDSQLSDIATGAAQQAQRTLYSYTGDSQLTGESTTPIAGQGQNTASSWSRGYGYDAMGNRTSATQTNEDGVISNSSSTANKLNQLTAYSTNTTTGTTSSAIASALIYDARGNLSEQSSKVNDVDAGKSRYGYDDLNRLVSLTSLNAGGVAQSQTRFVYDGASRKRIQATFSWLNGAWQQTSEKRYLYDGMEVVQERDENNAVIASNLWSGSVGGLLARRTQNATLFPSYDGIGNVTGLTDGTGARVAKYRYDAFGNILEASGAQAQNNPYRFSTKEAVGGLYYYGFRFYSPGLGRWINRDPLKEAGGMNVYAFCANDPIGLIDPDGLTPTQAEYANRFFGMQGAMTGAALGGMVAGPGGALAGAILGGILAPALFSMAMGCEPAQIATAVGQGVDEAAPIIIGEGAAIVVQRIIVAATATRASRSVRLYWSGTKEAVALREAEGIFAAPPGKAANTYWATTRSDTGWLTRMLNGGSTNMFPNGITKWPVYASKGAIEATYPLSQAEAAFFKPASGLDYSWNPLMWYKGGVGQYWVPVPRTAVERGLQLAAVAVEGGIVAKGGYYYFFERR